MVIFMFFGLLNSRTLSFHIFALETLTLCYGNEETLFIYFKGRKSSDIRILELLKLPLPSPQQVLNVHKVPTINIPRILTELSRDNRLDPAALFWGLLPCSPKECPVQRQGLPLNTR
uniref:Uncharacterized protein n=1 Tax=Arundo donax TaxID=35708 RepID=A0A0A8XYI9_ARUDO